MPEHLSKLNNAVVLHHNAFILKQFLHKRRRFKMVAAAEFAFSVNNPVRWHIVHVVAIVERPTHHTGSAEGKEISDRAVVRHAAARHLPHNGINEVVIRWLLFHNWDIYRSMFLIAIAKSLLAFYIERIAKAIAHQVKCQHRQGDGKSRRQGKYRLAANGIAIILIQHRAPRRRRRLYAKA